MVYLCDVLLNAVLLSGVSLPLAAGGGRLLGKLLLVVRLERGDDTPQPQHRHTEHTSAAAQTHRTQLSRSADKHNTPHPQRRQTEHSSVTAQTESQPQHIQTERILAGAQTEDSSASAKTSRTQLSRSTDTQNTPQPQWIQTEHTSA